ncbi:MAG: CHAD domain-containing protein [Proteobacteria bacterium]|nr:CHAD domain-containing protein [Pseudomonadota bacterium]
MPGSGTRKGATLLEADAAGFAACCDARNGCDRVLRNVIRHGTAIVMHDLRAQALGTEPEYVHQARTAVRRMRSAVRLFRHQVAFPPDLATALHDLAALLGEARDWDVVTRESLPALRHGAGVGVGPLATQGRAARLRAYQALREAVAAPAFSLLEARLLQWASADEAVDSATVHDFARPHVARITARLATSTRRFRRIDAAQRHRVRIRLKRLRFALELLGDALPRRATHRQLRALARVLQTLGQLQDLQVLKARLPEVVANPGGCAWLDATEAALLETAATQLATWRCAVE